MGTFSVVCSNRMRSVARSCKLQCQERVLGETCRAVQVDEFLKYLPRGEEYLVPSCTLRTSSNSLKAASWVRLEQRVTLSEARLESLTVG